ncbi:hypothetical protein [Vibrio sp. TRT 29B02]|uniref:hypothetical protein n=1 Tax=Vibrio sp. TRT 29B02 TaxID=3418508 RepID=UPI003CE92788
MQGSISTEEGIRYGTTYYSKAHSRSSYESIAEARSSDCLTETFTGFDMNNYIESKHKQ